MHFHTCVLIYAVVARFMSDRDTYISRFSREIARTKKPKFEHLDRKTRRAPANGKKYCPRNDY